MINQLITMIHLNYAFLVFNHAYNVLDLILIIVLHALMKKINNWCCYKTIMNRIQLNKEAAIGNAINRA